MNKTSTYKADANPKKQNTAYLCALMNVSYYIARRVAASGQRSFSRLILRIAVVAVALSVSVMIAATSLIAGFKKEISDKIFGFWGHIHITDPNLSQSLVEAYPISVNQPFYPSIDTVRQVRYLADGTRWGQSGQQEMVTQGGIRHIQAFAVKAGIIKAKDEIEGIILKGVGKDFDWSFLRQYLVKGDTISLPDTSFSKEILISQQTANRLKVDVNDKFDIHFVERGEQLRRRFTVAGIYKTGLDEYDRKFALVDIRQIQRLLNWNEDQVSGFEVFIEDIDDLTPISEYIYFEQLPTNLYAETIRDKLPEIFEWLDLQNINEAVILALMIIVAIINMITALLILILERTNMIGTLKALGATNWRIRGVFLYYAAYIILTGLFFGNLLGLGFCWIQDQFELIKLDETNYYLSVAPIAINWWLVLALNIGTLVVTLVCLVVPSYLISRIDPVKAIRFK